MYTEVVGFEPVMFTMKECAWYLNDNHFEIVPDKSNCPLRGLSEREIKFIESEVSTSLPNMFSGEGRNISFEPLFKILSFSEAAAATPTEGCDYAAFVLKYNQSPFIAVDTRSNMEIKPANTNNLVYIVFWKRYPRTKYLFYRRDTIHVPLYLIKTSKKLIEYISCRIFDQVDEATLHWKRSTDPSGNQHCLVNKYGKRP